MYPLDRAQSRSTNSIFTLFSYRSILAPMDTLTTNYQYGLLFGGEPVSESEKARVIEEIKKVGSLTFSLSLNEEGWVAQCNEMPSLIAGNTNPSPSNIEIKSEIRATIFSAFDVQTEQMRIESPYQEFKYSIVKE